MNELHRDVALLLDVIRRMRQRHRAGIGTTCDEQGELFEQADIVEADLAAVARGLVPPAVPRRERRGRLTLERVDGAPIRMTMLTGTAARAVLESLPAAAGGER